MLIYANSLYGGLIIIGVFFASFILVVFIRYMYLLLKRLGNISVSTKKQNGYEDDEHEDKKQRKHNNQNHEKKPEKIYYIVKEKKSVNKPRSGRNTSYSRPRRINFSDDDF